MLAPHAVLVPALLRPVASHPPLGPSLVLQHQTWTYLFRRQEAALSGRACSEALEGVASLKVACQVLPDLTQLSRWLQGQVGWTLCPVDGLVEPSWMLERLARRVVPVSRKLRPAEEVDFTPAPDLFHDLFGHLPMLFDTRYRTFLQELGVRSLAAGSGTLEALSRLLWFTAEVGMVMEDGVPRVFGGTLLSSHGELSSMDDKRGPRLQRFEIEEVLASPFEIDRPQPRLFVLDSLDSLPCLVDDLDQFRSTRPLRACA